MKGPHITAERLDHVIEWEGGLVETLQHGIRSEDIEDDQLRTAWIHLRREWERFEPEMYAFEAILNGKLRHSTAS